MAAYLDLGEVLCEGLDVVLWMCGGAFLNALQAVSVSGCSVKAAV